MTNRRYIGWLTFATVLSANLLLSGGRPRQAVDTSLYVRLADGMRMGDLSGIWTLAAARWSKLTYLSILALARAFSPAHWMMVMLLLNVICGALTAVLLVRVVRPATRWSWTWVVALFLYLSCWDIWSWIPYMLTDVLYALVGFIPFMLVARRVVNENEPPRAYLLAASCLFAVFSRPIGIVLIPLVLFVELVLVRRRVRGHIAAAVIVLLAVAAIGVRTSVVHDPARWPFRFLQPRMIEFSGREKTGEVVYGRRETFRPPPRTMTDHLIIEGDRFVRFFQITASSNSRLHNLASLAYFVPLYVLGLIGAAAGLMEKDQRRRNLVITLLIWLGVFALFHALTILDYDWRFRFPLIPHMIVLAACGVDWLAGWWTVRWAQAPVHHRDESLRPGEEEQNMGYESPIRRRLQDPRTAGCL